MGTLNCVCQHGTLKIAVYCSVLPAVSCQVLGAACLASVGMYWLNRRMYHSTPDSMTPEFQVGLESARHAGRVAL